MCVCAIIPLSNITRVFWFKLLTYQTFTLSPGEAGEVVGSWTWTHAHTCHNSRRQPPSVCFNVCRRSWSCTFPHQAIARRRESELPDSELPDSRMKSCTTRFRWFPMQTLQTSHCIHDSIVSFFLNSWHLKHLCDDMFARAHTLKVIKRNKTVSLRPCPEKLTVSR